MNRMNKNPRWYDTDPTLSLAISFIKNAPDKQQTEIAKKIIERVKAKGIKVNALQAAFRRRWYDENEELSLAMEYLNKTKEEDRKLIAVEIIDFLTEIKE